MLGAVIGDFVGSVYEYAQTKGVRPIYADSILDDGAFFSDDSILTVAIADSILSGESYEKKLKQYAKKYVDYRPDAEEYFEGAFSRKFMDWAVGDYQGTSKGNGAMMRVSPVGYLFDNEKDVIENAILATIPSHNSKEAVSSAVKVALTIFYARQGRSKEEILKSLGFDQNAPRPQIDKFNVKCSDTLPLCFYSLFNGQSFEDCLRLALSFGGDTDTNCCIVGSMAEAFYPIDSALAQKVLERLPLDLASKLAYAEKRKTILTEKSENTLEQLS